MKSKTNFSKKQAFSFVMLEALLILSIIIQAVTVLKIKIIDNSLVYLNSVPSFNEVALLVLGVIVFAGIYFKISIKDKKVLLVHKEFSKLISGTTKQKVKGLNREVLTLLFFEIVFAVVIAFAIYLYLDPEVNVVPWPMNYITFIAFVGFGLFIFSKTKSFREAQYGDSFVKKKIMPAHRLFPTRRITNRKTGSIRLKHKK